MTPSMAHAGGWDELLAFLVAPLLLVLGSAVARLIKRRRGPRGDTRPPQD